MSAGTQPDPFDEKAATWDSDPAHVERAKIVAERIVEIVNPTSFTKVLEYGAGTGLVSEFLSPHVGELTLVDTSAGMRDVIAQKVSDGRLPGARVWSLDLSHDPVPDESFDLVVTVLTLHHVADLDAVLVAMRALLSEGGSLCVVDLDKEDGSFHGDGFGGHHGFARPEFESRLRQAGFGVVSISDCHHIVREDGTFPMFLAVAKN